MDGPKHTTGKHPTPRGRPAFADTQQQEILRLLREAGTSGVSRAYLIFNHHFTQCGARVNELKRQGYVVESELLEGDRYVRYILRNEPLGLTPLPEGADWYSSASGKPRPKEADGPSPLFEKGASR